MDVGEVREQGLHIGQRCPADLDPTGDDVGRPPQSVGDPLVVHVNHRGRNCGPGVRRGDSRPHLTRAQHAHAADWPRFDVGVGHAPVAGEQILHEEDADECRRDGCPHHSERLLQFDLEPILQRTIDPIADRPQRRQGSRVLALGRSADRSFSDTESEIQLIVTETNRLLFPLPQFLPFAAFLRVLDEPPPLFDEPLTGDGIEHKSTFGRFGRADRFARGDHGDCLLHANDARQTLCSAPAGNDAHFHFRQADLGRRVCGGDPVIHGERDFGAAAHAVAVDESDGRKRQAAHPIEKIVAGGQSGCDLLLGVVGQGAQFVEVGPGDELPGLGAFQQQSAKIGPLAQIVHQSAEFLHDRLAERIDALAGQIEGQ